MVAVYRRNDGHLVLEREGETLAGCDLTHADLLYGALAGFDLSEANLRSADMCNADLQGANLTGATLTGADLTLSNCVQADFSGACLGDARLQAINRATPGPASTVFRRADCTRTTLKHSNLSRCVFVDATMPRADLTRCNLRGADFTGADLAGADLSFCDLTDASLAHSSLVGATLTGCELHGADLQGADLSLANLSGIRARGARFANSLWSKTVLARASGLDEALGLDDVRLGDACSIDVWTLRDQMSAIPESLLAHAGVTPALLELLRQLPKAATDQGRA